MNWNKHSSFKIALIYCSHRLGGRRRFAEAAFNVLNQVWFNKTVRIEEETKESSTGEKQRSKSFFMSTDRTKHCIFFTVLR